jgi:prepilin-type N-terminal cleavage/methylation domain-containing protein
MLNPGTARKGFTLGEVLVSVAIVAVLAAVVIPAIGSQITKGDQGRVASDIQAVRGGVVQFVSDVRRYPKSLGQLVVVPLTTNSPMTPTTVTYTSQELARWRGPYLSKDSVAAGNTGYGLRLGIGAATFTFDTLIVGTTGVFTPASPGGGDIRYLILTIPNMNLATAQALDASMDDGDVTAGAIRWKAAGDASNGVGAVDTLKYLLTPIIR